MTNESQAGENTDLHLWPLVGDEPFPPKLHVTKEGALGINVGGYVIVKPIREWHSVMKEACTPPHSEGTAASDADRELAIIITALRRYEEYVKGNYYVFELAFLCERIEKGTWLHAHSYAAGVEAGRREAETTIKYLREELRSMRERYIENLAGD